jgi:Sel1 repeat
VSLVKSVVLALGLLCGQFAHAQSQLNLEELLQIAWESSWGQSGAPLPVLKWTGPLKIRLQGDRAAQRHAMVVQMLDELAALTGRSYELVSDPLLAVQATIAIVTDSNAVSDSTPCITSYQSDGNGLKSAQVTVRDRVISRCLMHELGHLLGIPGHPMGKTVMTYFGGGHSLTDYDKYLLRLRYSNELPHGSSPFAFVKLAGERYIAALSDASEKDAAHLLLRQFLATLNADMTAYASGEGEPPRVLFRAGRIKGDAVERGRITMQVFLGMSYLLGQLVEANALKAQPFFQTAAEQGHIGAQFMLGVLHRNEAGPVRDVALSHQWYACSARNGLGAAQTGLESLEKQLDATQIDSVRQQTKQFLEQGKCRLQAPAT